jgi:hypothetical protein
MFLTNYYYNLCRYNVTPFLGILIATFEITSRMREKNIEFHKLVMSTQK